MGDSFFCADFAFESPFLFFCSQIRSLLLFGIFPSGNLLKGELIVLISENGNKDKVTITNRNKKFKPLALANPKLAKQWHPEKNGDLTSYNVSAYSKLEVSWLYPYDDPKTGHHDFVWKARISDRNKSDRYPYLSGKMVWTGFNDLATVNPQLAAEWDYKKNKKLTPEKVTVGKNMLVWWLLPYDVPDDYHNCA